MAAQDPNELFDLVAEDGSPLGRTKPRALVHRDGDWHRSVHIWVVLLRGPDAAGGPPWVLFQQRSRQKDTWPGALDIAVTGHLAAGETVADALREAREEIGLALGPADVTRLGLRRRIDRGTPDVVDRELQDIFLARVELPLHAFRPDPAELAALVALPLDDAGAVFRGEIDDAAALCFEAGAPSHTPTRVRRADFVGASDGYYARAQGSVAALIRGELAPAWEIG